MENGMGASIGASLARIEADAQSLSSSGIGSGAPPAIAPNLGGDTAPELGEGFRQMILGVNEQDRLAGEKMAAVDSGRSDDLVGAMLASQQASLSFSMLMQARNKVVGAMEDLIKLQL